MEQDNVFKGEEAPLAVLVSVVTPDEDEHEAAVSLDELENCITATPLRGGGISYR